MLQPQRKNRTLKNWTGWYKKRESLKKQLEKKKKIKKGPQSRGGAPKIRTKQKPKEGKKGENPQNTRRSNKKKRTDNIKKNFRRNCQTSWEGAGRGLMCGELKSKTRK